MIMDGDSSSTKSMLSQAAEETETLEIPEQLFQPSIDIVYLYVLTSVSLGAASHPIQDWEERALLKEEVKWDKSGHAIRVAIPEKIRRFYNMNLSKLDVTGVPEKDLVIILIDFAS
jgi:hypothetical protein